MYPFDHRFLKWYFRILDDNQIHVLKQGMLDSLKNIEFLSIRRNKLERIPKFGPDHAKLKHLDLSENQLEKIDAFTFRFLNNLESLNLSKNHLKGIDYNFVKIFRPFFQWVRYEYCVNWFWPIFIGKREAPVRVTCPEQPICRKWIGRRKMTKLRFNPIIHHRIIFEKI